MKKGLAAKLAGIFILIIIVVSISAAVMVATDAKEEGIEYAQNRTTLDCLNEVTIGEHICMDTSCFLGNRYFYQSCMDNAGESEELCDSLPEIRALLKLEIWKKKQCKSLGRTDRGCHHIWLKALEVCGK